MVLLLAALAGGQVSAQEPTAAAAAAPAPAGGGDAAAGKALFEGNNCNTCHAVTAEKLVGPGLKGVVQRTPGKE